MDASRNLLLCGLCRTVHREVHRSMSALSSKLVLMSILLWILPAVAAAACCLLCLLPGNPQVQPLDPADTLAAEGQPVQSGVAVLLIHCATQAPLAIDAGELVGRLPAEPS